MFFFGVFEKFETFFSKICADSERYRNFLAGIFEILTFYRNIAFPLLSPVLLEKIKTVTVYRLPIRLPAKSAWTWPVV